MLFAIFVLIRYFFKDRIVKRVPHRAPTRQNEIYVSRKSHAKAQLARAKSLLLHPDVRKRVNSITVFGLGAAMAAAVDLALRIVDAAAPQVVIDVVTTTGTTPLHDDYEPLVEGVPAFTRTRYNGLVRIDLTRRPAAAVTASAAVASKT
jgi:hypothetical protein